MRPVRAALKGGPQPPAGVPPKAAGGQPIYDRRQPHDQEVTHPRSLCFVGAFERAWITSSRPLKGGSMRS